MQHEAEFPPVWILFPSSSKISRDLGNSARSGFADYWHLKLKKIGSEYCNCDCPVGDGFSAGKDEIYIADSEWRTALILWDIFKDGVHIPARIPLFPRYNDIELIGSYNMNYRISINCQENELRFQGLVSNILSTESGNFSSYAAFKKPIYVL